jgi:dihydrofolate reductase
MGKLVYSMITSLDGYAEAAEGDLGAGAEVEEVHTFIEDRFRSVGTFLYGRRMYETMVYWETVHEAAAAHIQDYAEIWQAADKIVYSKSLDAVSSDRTRIERSFEPEAVRRLKTEGDIGIGGAALASEALRAGLVDEYQTFVAPVVVGGGKRALPDDVHLDLELVDERRFGNGTVYLRYLVT